MSQIPPGRPPQSTSGDLYTPADGRIQTEDTGGIAGPPPPSGGSLLLWLVVGGALAVAVLGAGAFLIDRRDGEEAGPANTTTTGGGGSEVGGEGEVPGTVVDTSVATTVHAWISAGAQADCLAMAGLMTEDADPSPEETIADCERWGREAALFYQELQRTDRDDEAIAQAEVNGNAATVHLEIDPPPIALTLHLVQEAGVWKIDAY